MDKNKKKKKSSNSKEQNSKRKAIIIPIVAISIIVILIGIILSFKDAKRKITLNYIIEHKQSAYVFITNSDKTKCSKCASIQERLDEKEINYVMVDVNKYSKEELKKLMKKADLIDDNMEYPALIYYSKGYKYISFSGLVDKSNVDNFIETVHSNVAN